MKKRTLIGVMSLILWLSGCRDSLDRPVIFIVPDGFKGPILLVTDRGEKKRPEKTEQGFVIEIPDSGILKIETKGVLNRWHKVEARYKSGATIPEISPALLNNPEEGFMGGFSSVRGNDERQITWYFVGSKIDYDQIVHGQDSFERMSEIEKRIK